MIARQGLVYRDSRSRRDEARSKQGLKWSPLSCRPPTREEFMKKPMILACVAMLALGVIAIQAMRPVAAKIESQAQMQTMAPFEMMRDARDLPTDVNINAI